MLLNLHLEILSYLIKNLKASLSKIAEELDGINDFISMELGVFDNNNGINLPTIYFTKSS